MGGYKQSKESITEFIMMVSKRELQTVIVFWSYIRCTRVKFEARVMPPWACSLRNRDAPMRVSLHGKWERVAQVNIEHTRNSFCWVINQWTLNIWNIRPVMKLSGVTHLEEVHSCFIQCCDNMSKVLTRPFRECGLVVRKNAHVWPNFFTGCSKDPTQKRVRIVHFVMRQLRVEIRIREPRHSWSVAFVAIRDTIVSLKVWLTLTWKF